MEGPINPGSRQEFAATLGQEANAPAVGIAYSKALEDYRISLSLAAGVSLEDLHDIYQTGSVTPGEELPRQASIQYND